MTQQLRITPLRRPIDNLDRLDAPITPERQAASEAYQQRAALREQFESEWVPPEGYSAERDEEEMENTESAAFTVWEERRKGRTVAATTPVWEGSTFERWLIDGPEFENSGMLAKQPTAASLTLPIILKGGGDMKVTFETRKYVDTKYHPEPRTWFEREHKLTVRTEHGVFLGYLEEECCERSWYVVSLPSTAPQAVADRIANTLDAINELNLAEDYFTIMPVSDRCSICARPLTDIVSKTLGIGPDCAASLGVKHSAAVADAIIARRRAFLAEEATS
jgi:Family of unknown function (DUF6011)